MFAVSVGLLAVVCRNSDMLGHMLLVLCLAVVVSAPTCMKAGLCVHACVQFCCLPGDGVWVLLGAAWFRMCCCDCWRVRGVGKMPSRWRHRSSSMPSTSTCCCEEQCRWGAQQPIGRAAAQKLWVYLVCIVYSVWCVCLIEVKALV